MDEHSITVQFEDGTQWKCTTTDKQIADTVWNKFGQRATSVGYLVAEWMSHTVTAPNGPSKVTWCERAIDFKTGKLSRELQEA